MSNEESLYNVAKEEYIEGFKNTPSQGSKVLDSIATQTVPLEGTLKGLRESETHIEEAEKKKNNAWLYLLIGLVVTAALIAAIVALFGAATATGATGLFLKFVAANTTVIATIFGILTGGTILGLIAKVASANSKVKEEQKKAQIVNTVRKTAEKQYVNATVVDAKNMILERENAEHEIKKTKTKNEEDSIHTIHKKDMAGFEANKEQGDFIKKNNITYKKFTELNDKHSQGTATKAELEELVHLSNHFLKKNRENQINPEEMATLKELDEVKNFVTRNMDKIETAKNTMIDNIQKKSKLGNPESTLHTISTQRGRNG